MNMKKLLAGAAAAGLAAAAMSVCASAAAVSGSLAAELNDYDKVTHTFYLEHADARLMAADYSWTADTKISLTLTTENDPAEWKIMVFGFDSSWGGWKSVDSNVGVTTFTTTVGAVAEANGYDLDTLAGIDIQVGGVQEDAAATFTLTVGDEEAALPLPDPEPSPNPVVPPEEEGKQPNTGVGGVAAVLGVGVIAGGAMVVSKKKK